MFYFYKNIYFCINVKIAFSHNYENVNIYKIEGTHQLMYSYIDLVHSRNISK